MQPGADPRIVVGTKLMPRIVANQSAATLLLLCCLCAPQRSLCAQQVSSDEVPPPRVTLGLPQPIDMADLLNWQTKPPPANPSGLTADRDARPVTELKIPARPASGQQSVADLPVPPPTQQSTGSKAAGVERPVAPQASQPSRTQAADALPSVDPRRRNPNSLSPPPLSASPPAASALEALPNDLFSGQSSRGPEAVPARPAPPQSLLAPRQNSDGRLAPQTGSASPQPTKPEFFSQPGDSFAPNVDGLSRRIPFQPQDFLPAPITDQPVDPILEASPYRRKFAVPVQRPWVELWRPLYTGGIYPPARTWFGETNPVMPHFMVYGDFRTGVGINRNAAGDANSWANRLNLDMDLEITATERIHAFMGPLDRAGDFTRIDFSDSAEFVDRTDMRFDTLFFEGDVGAMLGGLEGTGAPFDLPIALGFLPLIYQNGIWANDNVIGAAAALPAKNSPLLRWSNFDATFFWASDQVTTDAFAGDNNAAEFFGTAWFIDAYGGYIEADYAFVHDDAGAHRSYHNLSVAFTRRYLARLSNSIRFITNFGQSLPSGQRTADGHLLLIENSLISAQPNTFVPYCNLFYGQGRPQSLARAGIVGGVLNNTGINFETDGLTGYPTLDATAHNAFGAALGLNMLGSNFEQQLIVELAALGATGSQPFRNALGDQYACGLRYQRPLTNAWIFRTDHMYGWLRGAEDLRGSRIEFRWKF